MAKKTLDVSAKFSAVDRFSKKVGRMGRASERFANSTQAGLARVNRASRRLAHQTQGLTSRIFNLRNAAAALALGMVARQAVRFANSQAEAADETAKLARQLDLSSQQLEEYRYVAERAGVDSSMLDSSMETLSKRLGELQAGTGALRSRLEAMGRHGLVEQLEKTNSVDEAFKIMTKTMEGAENQVQRNTIASAMFSKGGMQMERVMSQGNDAIDEQRQKFQRFYGEGALDKLGDQAEDYMDAQKDMTTAIEGAKTTIAVELIPQITALQKKITNWVSNNRELIATKVQDFIERVANVMRWLVDNARLVINTIKGLVGVMVALKAINIAARVVTVASTAALWAYNVALGIHGALSKKASIAIGASTVAMKAHLITTKIVTGAKAAYAVAQWAANAALKAFPLSWILTAIGALIGAIVWLVKNWDKVRATMLGVWEVIKTGFKMIKIYMISPIELLIKLITGLGKTLYYVFTGQFRKAIEEGKNTFGELKDKVVEDADKMMSLAGGMGEDFQRGFDKGMEDVSQKQERKMTPMGQPQGGMGEDFQRNFDKGMEDVSQKQERKMTPMGQPQGDAETAGQKTAFNRQTQVLQAEGGGRGRGDRLMIGINDDTGRARVDEDTGGYIMPETEETMGGF